MTAMPPTRRLLLEVAIASVADAVTAQAGGADRVELSTALSLGGLTPSLGLVVEVRQAITLPLIVMARPRSAGFFYTDAELRVMQRDIDLILAQGADGIAFGLLTATGEIDRERCKRIVHQIGDRQAVFHRAFDVTPDPLTALEVLIDLGVQRIMTSGQEENAVKGAGCIAELIRRSAGRVEVLPAGGINPATVAEVLARTGCDQVHASLRRSHENRSTAARAQVRFGGAGMAEGRFDATSPEAVRQMRELLGG
jgi:copper homeostasis protein